MNLHKTHHTFGMSRGITRPDVRTTNGGPAQAPAPVALGSSGQRSSQSSAVEQKIRESGIAYTFLRPNLFMQGLLAFRDTIVGQGKFFAAAADAKISAVDVRDIAAVAAAALTEEGNAGRTYDLTGPEALTRGEMAAKLSHALDRDIQYVDIPPEAMMDALLGIGLPLWQAEGLIEDYAHYRLGEASAVATGVQDATGVPPHSFDQFARDYALAFS